MSELYIGTDIVDVERIKTSIDNYSAKFLNKIFSQEEQWYCNSKSNPEIHYSGRFAAKEAIIKAIQDNYSYVCTQVLANKIELGNDIDNNSEKISGYNISINIK